MSVYYGGHFITRVLSPMETLFTLSPFTVPNLQKSFFSLEYRGIFVLCPDDDQRRQNVSCNQGSSQTRRDVNQDGGPVYNLITQVTGNTHHLFFSGS